MGDIGDIFDTFFVGGFGGSRRANPNAPRQGSDIRTQINISFFEACSGVKKRISVARSESCPACNGTGAENGTAMQTCPDCGGSGQIRTQRRTPIGMVSSQTTCEKCGGRGRIIEKACPHCNGKGSVSATKTVEVQIPAGIDDGQTLSLGGQGNAGANGGPPGDLLVLISVRPDSLFTRKGYDIYCEIPISFYQAVTGDELTIPTIDGNVKYNLPEGTQPGAIFRLRGKGIQRINSRSRGDQYVTVMVEVPKNLTRQQLEKLKEFDDAITDKQTAKKKKFSDKIKEMFEGKNDGT